MMFLFLTTLHVEKAQAWLGWPLCFGPESIIDNKLLGHIPAFFFIFIFFKIVFYRNIFSFS